jgi:hypothetical protein
MILYDASESGLQQKGEKNFCFIASSLGKKDLGFFVSNGHSPANLSNLSTRQKFAIFGEFEYLPKWSFWKIGRTRYIWRHLPTCFGRT